MEGLMERHIGIARAQLASGASDRVEPLLANVLLLGIRQVYASIKL
jgi:hypothetical protein